MTALLLHRFIALFCVALLACAPAPARAGSRGTPLPSSGLVPGPTPVQSAPPERAAEVIVIRGARIFDGEHVLPRASVVVRGGRIASLGDETDIPPGAQVVDGTGNTLLPGLIDAHAHVGGAQALKNALLFGVTTVLDLFADPASIAAVKAELRRDPTAMLADVRSAGAPVVCRGCVASSFGPFETLDDPSQADAFIRRRIAEGSDFIKIVYDDGAAFHSPLPALSKATLGAAVAAAHAQGKIAVVHVSSLAGARDVVDVGGDGLAHLFMDAVVDVKLARRAAARKLFAIATLGALQSYLGRNHTALATDPDLAPFISAPGKAHLATSSAEGWKKTYPGYDTAKLRYENAQATVRALRDAGVAILAGTDAPVAGMIHGASLHGEIELLAESGLSPLEALIAATSAPAHRFALADRGRIAPGLRADLVLVKGDPTTDIKATRRIVAVWNGGRLVERKPRS